jgi:gamma-glutamylcyclotransferase (GGCT)/AIG2-like uncharacterized protein YtfP
MPLYFAYGANMDVADMASRAPQSRLIGLAQLPRHRFIIMAEGYASIVRDPRQSVHGVLWDLALADLRPLDRFEGIDRGLYAKINQPVITEQGAKRALVYVAANGEPGRPRPGYLEGILAAAHAHGFPKPYLDALARWKTGAKTVAATASPLTGPVAGVQPRAASPDRRPQDDSTGDWDA